MVAKAKSSYKVSNWREYNESLVQRGSITFWFSEEVLAEWQHTKDEPKVGHPFVYSDRAIESLLALRELFRLPLRQTTGLAQSLVKMMQASVTIPHYSLLSKRGGKLDIEAEIEPIIPPRRNAKIKQHGNASQPPLKRDEAIRGVRRVANGGSRRLAIIDVRWQRLPCIA